MEATVLVGLALVIGSVLYVFHRAVLYIPINRWIVRRTLQDNYPDEQRLLDQPHFDSRSQ